MDLYGVDAKTCEIFSVMAFEHYSTVAARLALGEGVSRETVAMSLRNLADAIETQDCAEDMSPIDPLA
jgi:hypothetical protein